MGATVTATAPGKLVLSGEYAVLDGAPAIALAVNRRAHATITAVEGSISRVAAPGHCQEIGEFYAAHGAITWSQGARHFSLLDAVWRCRKGRSLGASAMTLDTSEFIVYDSAAKAGIGSSAAMTVALCAALENTCDIAELAYRSHEELQGGAGSGVDIACSLFGGLIEYRMDGRVVTPLQWPNGLAYCVLWSGTAASTRVKLEQLARQEKRSSHASLKAEAETMAAVWHSGEAIDVLAAYTNYIEALRHFSADHELGIFEAGHEELAVAAAASGLVYKPCGAGGGDVGILLGLDKERLLAFVEEQVVLQSCTRLNYEIESFGVRLETTETHSNE